MSSESKNREKRELTHLSESGEARMVDVGKKPPTVRRAVATAEVHLGREAWEALLGGNVPKGDALAVARIAGIQAAKRTAELIPLCHPLMLTKVSVELLPLEKKRTVRIAALIQCEGRTGVEMEALTAVSVAALALYDMLKSIDRAIVIGPIRLEEKAGGKSGHWRRE